MIDVNVVRREHSPADASRINHQDSDDHEQNERDDGNPLTLLVRAALERVEELLDGVDRDGETYSDVPGNRAFDRVVDTDHLAQRVEQRTA